jgi:hypothetical protein
LTWLKVRRTDRSSPARLTEKRGTAVVERSKRATDAGRGGYQQADPAPLAVSTANGEALIEVAEVFTYDTAPTIKITLSRLTPWRECRTELGMSRPFARWRGAATSSGKSQYSNLPSARSPPGRSDGAAIFPCFPQKERRL